MNLHFCRFSMNLHFDRVLLKKKFISKCTSFFFSMNNNFAVYYYLLVSCSETRKSPICFQKHFNEIRSFKTFLQANECFIERAPLVFSLPVSKSVFPAKLLLGHPRLISVAAPSTRAPPRALDKLTSATTEESSTPWTGHRSQNWMKINTYRRI